MTMDGCVPSTITYFDPNTGELPVEVIIENFYNMAFGIINCPDGKYLVCRWNGSKEKPIGYPAGRRGPCWMLLPKELFEPWKCLKILRKIYKHFNNIIVKEET